MTLIIVLCEADLDGNFPGLKPCQSDVARIGTTILALKLKWNNFEGEICPYWWRNFLIGNHFPRNFCHERTCKLRPRMRAWSFSLGRNIVTWDQCNRMETEWENGQYIYMYFKQRVSTSCQLVTNICWDPFFRVWKCLVTSSFYSFTIWFLMPSNAIGLNTGSC